MDNIITDIINKIDKKITYYESQNVDYKKYERIILDKFLPFDEFLNSNDDEKFINLIYFCVIKNEKYNDLSRLVDIKKNFKNYSLYIITEYIDTYMNESYSDPEEKIKECLNSYGMYNPLDEEENYEDITNNIVKFYEVLSYIDRSDLILLNIFLSIYDILEKTSLTTMKNTVNCFYEDLNNSGIKENINRINILFDDILKKKNEYTNEIKKLNKIYTGQIKKLRVLKKNILLSLNKEEITNIDEMIELAGEDFKIDIVNYINLKNSKYNKKIEEKYIDFKKNSISNYIDLFRKYSIEFASYSCNDQKYIMMLGIDSVKFVFNFLKKIDFNINKSVIKIMYNTNRNIIENIEEYVKKGFITYNYIKNNIEIIFDNEMSSESFYGKFIQNMNILLKNKINIKNLDEDGMNFYKEDPELIEKNIKMLNKTNININTRILRNYNFLGKKNLMLFIKCLLNEGVDINNNIYLLNSDFNIIKRIHICKKINADIYEDKMIKKDILNKDLFFIPDSKIDEYVNEKTLVLN